MSAIFIDLDGTCLRYHTNEWLPGVVDRLLMIHNGGSQIHFITMTGPQDEGEVYSVEARRKVIDDLPFKPASVTFGVQSPRILVDDSRVAAITTETNSADWLNALK